MPEINPNPRYHINTGGPCECCGVPEGYSCTCFGRGRAGEAQTTKEDAEMNERLRTNAIVLSNHKRMSSGLDGTLTLAVACTEAPEQCILRVDYNEEYDEDYDSPYFSNAEAGDIIEITMRMKKRYCE